MGSGASLTSLTPANISAGSLPATVIVSSLAVNAVYTDAITNASVTDGKIVSMSASKLAGANLPGGSTSYIQITNALQASSTFS